MKKVKMNWSRAVLISLPFFAVTLFWSSYDYIVPLILSRHYKLGVTSYSMIMSLDNLVALVFLPLFGALSDKINGRMGRRSPLILWGSIGGLIGFYFMNWADTRAVSGENTFTIFMIAMAIAVFFMSMYRSPTAALGMDCFIRPHRTNANAVLNILGAIAGVLFAIIGKRMIKVQDGIVIFTECINFVILAMVISTAFYFLFMRENRFVADVQKQNAELGLIDKKTDVTDKSPTKLTESEKKSFFLILGAIFFVFIGYNAYNTHYTNYLVTYLQKEASWTTPSLLKVLFITINMIPAALIATKIGRKKSVIIGSIITAIAYFGSSTVTPEHANMLYIWFFIMSIGFPMVSINLGPMVVELGKDSDAGRYMGYYYIAATVAQIISPTFASFFINMAGYNIIGLYAGFFSIVTLVVTIFIRHGDAKPIPSNALNEAISIGD